MVGLLLGNEMNFFKIYTGILIFLTFSFLSQLFFGISFFSLADEQTQAGRAFAIVVMWIVWFPWAAGANKWD